MDSINSKPSLIEERLSSIEKNLSEILRSSGWNVYSASDIALNYYHKALLLNKLGDTQNSLNAITESLRYSPYRRKSLALYKSILGSQKRISVSTKALGLIITCDKYFERASHLYRLMSQHDLPFEPKIVISDDAKKPPTNSPHIIRIKAGDHYEDLPSKVSEAFLEVALNYAANIGVFKIDDDISVKDFDQFSKACTRIINSNKKYVGFTVGRQPYLDRIWHWNKCSNQIMDRHIYGKRYTGAFNNGPFYYLSSKALSAFALDRIRFPDEILGAIFEDVFVASALRHAGITPSKTSASALSLSFAKNNCAVRRPIHERIQRKLGRILKAYRQSVEINSLI